VKLRWPGSPIVLAKEELAERLYKLQLVWTKQTEHE